MMLHCCVQKWLITAVEQDDITPNQQRAAHDKYTFLASFQTVYLLLCINKANNSNTKSDKKSPIKVH